MKILDDQYRVSGVIENADSQKSPVRAVIVEWDRDGNNVISGDIIDLTDGGVFVFPVSSPHNQYVAAYADTNRDGNYDAGEPLWFHRGTDGNPSPVSLDAPDRTVRVSGELSPANKAPADLIAAIAAAVAEKGVDSFITRQGVRFAVGEKADLDDPRFAATRGGDGLWTPATFAIQSGFGLYFRKDYHPGKTPVLFIHGAAGSPQDWRLAMEKLDPDIYQPWF